MTSYDAPAPPYVGPPAKHSGYGNKPITRIVLHGTVTPCEPGRARSVAAYFRSGSARGSAHYVVDPAEVVQVGYDSLVCWHAPPNGNSIGVEICDPVADPKTKKPLPLSRWDAGAHRRALRRAARLVAELCLAYDVPARMRGPRQLRAGGAKGRGLCEHDDVSKAFGQSSHWDLGAFPRRRFVRMVRREIEAIKAEAAGTPEPAEIVVSRITKARDLLEAALRRAKSPRRQRRIRAGLEALPPH